MARNERAGNCWSQPRQPASAKSRPDCNRGLGTGDFDDLGEIVNALTAGEKHRHRKDTWHLNKSIPKNGCYSSSDCCLKNGRVQCSCWWPKNTYMDQQAKGGYSLSSRPAISKRSALSYENKSSWKANNNSNGYFGNDKMPEEFILDDNELCLLNYYDIPIDVPRRPHIRNVGKVKTVSIIDTLSELASGATDREDEGGFSSAVSESAVLNTDFYRPRTRYARQPASRRGRGLGSNYIGSPSFPPKISPEVSSPFSKSALNTHTKSHHDSVSSFYSENLSVDDGNFSCSSLKRTLKYLRKAVSSNVVEEETRVRRHIRGSHDKQDMSRLCFSDSEIKDSPEHWTPVRKDKPEPNCQTKSRSLLTVTAPVLNLSQKKIPLFRGRVKAAVPDWIQEVFTAAKFGYVEKMKKSLKDIDSSLVRNLSDDHGNNLWHICAVHNNFECLNWLCSHNLYQGEALKDENKNGFTPVALAVKHGSLLAVQWLIHNTDSKSQLLSKGGCRSLLHVAARYGQDAVVEWLLVYMISQDLETVIVDSEGNTPLHLAAKYGHITSLKALIFHSGSLKVRNEHGLKPLDLAVKHSKTVCSDYLVAIESCYNLSAINIRHSWDIQQLQKENAEMKSHFKELLTLTKRLQLRQRELVQSLTRMDLSEQYRAGSSERLNEKAPRHLDDYSQLLATVMTDEEHRLLMVEDRWKKSRRLPKFSDSKKRPLDVLRSQFNHILDKVVNRCSPIAPTPETSDDSWPSGDDEHFHTECEHADFSAPDVVNSLSPQSSVPYLDTGRKFQKENENFPKVPKSIDRDIEYKPSAVSLLKSKAIASLFKTETTDTVLKNENSASVLKSDTVTSLLKSETIASSFKNETASSLLKNENAASLFKSETAASTIKSETAAVPALSKTVSGNTRDVNLQMFFKQNPNLRQSSETCSVLEVLEPSSSDSEDCINKKKRLAKSMTSDKEVEQSSSSSIVEIIDPYSCRISSSGSKASGSRSSSNGSRQNPFPKASRNSQTESSGSTTDKNRISSSKGNSSESVKEKGCIDHLSRNNVLEMFSAEPDLIKGTQKKKMPSPNNTVLDKEKWPVKDFILASDAILTDNPSISTEDSESLEVDRSFSSVAEIPDTLLPSQINSESSAAGTIVKKKNFLFKLALRGRWPSKTSPRSLKNEISPEEFRETYSRSTTVDNAPPSQLSVISDCPDKKKKILPKREAEIMQDNSPIKDVSGSNERLNDNSAFSLPSVTDGIRSHFSVLFFM